MSVKICPGCRGSNAVGNHNCVRCGQNLQQTRIKTEHKGNLYLAILNRSFTKLLIGCAAISAVLLLIAALNPGNLHLMALFGQGS